MSTVIKYYPTNSSAILVDWRSLLESSLIDGLPCDGNINDQLPIGAGVSLTQEQIDKMMHDYPTGNYPPDWLQGDWTGTLPGDNLSAYATPEERKRRKDAGECEECGTRREMTRFGLADCPNHPKPNGPQ